MSVTRTTFKSVSDFRETLLMNKLEVNLKHFFDWAFLKIGAWNNVTPPTLASSGADYALLRRVSDRSYTVGTLYESLRKDWVWETGVNYQDVDSATQNPTSPALIYVDGVLTAPDRIDYKNGRVVFSSALTSSNVVTAKYSYRQVQTYIADDVPWWQELQYGTQDPDAPAFDLLDEGSWGVGSQHRIQMPALIIEAVPRAVSTPYQLGDTSAWVEQDVLIHVLAEDRQKRNKLVDIMRSLYHATIWLFDNDQVSINSDWGLSYQGEILDSSQTYPALIDSSTGYRWKSCRFNATNVSEVEALNSKLYEGVVRLTCEVVLED